MASAQVDAAQVEEFIKPSEETTVGSPTIEGSAKAPAPEDIKSPYDEDDDDDDEEEEEEVILPDELTKHEDLDDEDEPKALTPQIIEDEDDEDEPKALTPQIIEDEDDEDEDDEAQDEEPVSKSAGRASDFSEEEGDDDEV